MTMPEHDDHEFESYLRQFRPHAPRPLPDERTVLFRRWAYPAAAAAVAAVVFSLATFLFLHPSLLHQPSRPEQPLFSRDQASRDQQISLLRLSVLADRDPEKFDAHLDRVSATLLPDVRSGNGVLKTLSAEEKF
jgi:hypothetical protein